MLSKILRGEEGQIAQPLPWRRAAGSPSPNPPLSTPQPFRPLQTSPVHNGPVHNSPGQTSPVHNSPVHNSPVHTRATASGFRQIVTTDDQVSVLETRVAELETIMDQRVREAREQALREGESSGRSQATVQVQPMLEQLARSIEELVEVRSKLRHQAEGDLLKLSVAIARKVLHRELSADPEALAGLIHVAMSKIRIQEVLRVRVHPQHQAVVQQLTQRLSGGAQLEVAGDPRLPLGGVLVETSRGEFDASIDVQLREIERGLADRLAARA